MSTAPTLLTPGPLTTSLRTRQAMLVDWGSWDEDFNRITHRVCEQLLAIASANATHHCVPLQGSGTFAIEAAIGTLVPRAGKVLLLINGAYGRRIANICRVLGRTCLPFETAEDQAVSAAQVDRLLTEHADVTHVVLVHCETSTGIRNPLELIAQVVSRHGKRLIIDAMSSFGAIPIDASSTPFEALIAASGKCLEGVPGMAFVLAQKHALAAAAGNAHSLALDLCDQQAYMASTGQWRFTPPTHVVAALHEALQQYAEQGGLPARARRYAENCECLLHGMAELGLRRFLPAEVQAPIIVTFHAPRDARYRFKDFYEGVKAKGFILYPGKLTEVDTFRVGCIGAVAQDRMQAAVNAVAEVLRDLHIRHI